MKKQILGVLLGAAFAFAAPSADDKKSERKLTGAQHEAASQRAGAYGTDRDADADNTAARRADRDVIYGQIKELKAGNEVVIHVPNAIDKTYSLAAKDKDTTVKMASRLKVGDEVRVTERERNGHKMVSIVKHPGALAMAQRGDTDRDRPRTDEADATMKGDTDVTYGQIKELKAGDEVKIHIPKAMDKSFDLDSKDKDTTINMASDLKVGDEVKVTETKHNGHKMVTIEKHPGALAIAERGDKDRRPRTDETGAASKSGKTHTKTTKDESKNQ